MEVNDNNFKKEVIEKSKTTLVLVDFFAPWCHPCQLLSPIIENLKKEYKNKVIIVKINIDENPKAAKEFNIRSVPNLKLFKNGKIVQELMGLAPESVIKDMLNKNV